MCNKILPSCNVCNCGYVVDSVLDASDQWVWMGEHGRDNWNAGLVQELWHLCESHMAYTNGIIFGIGRWLGCRLLHSRSEVDCSFQGEDQCGHELIAIWASIIVTNDITSSWTFNFACDMKSPVLHAGEGLKHPLWSYDMRNGRVMMLLTEYVN